MEESFPFEVTYVLQVKDEPRVIEIAQAQARMLVRAPGSNPFIADGLDSALFVRAEDEVIALVILRPWHEEDTLWLGMAWTAEAYRRKGIYRHLFRVACDLSAKQGFGKLGLALSPLNELSAKVHLALGARPVMFEVLVGDSREGRVA